MLINLNCVSFKKNKDEGRPTPKRCKEAREPNQMPANPSEPWLTLAHPGEPLANSGEPWLLVFCVFFFFDFGLNVDWVLPNTFSNFSQFGFLVFSIFCSFGVMSYCQTSSASYCVDARCQFVVVEVVTVALR